MENFNYELLDNLMNVYLGVGILLVIFIVICISRLIINFVISMSKENEELNKKIRKKEIIDVVKELNENGKN